MRRPTGRLGRFGGALLAVALSVSLTACSDDDAETPHAYEPASLGPADPAGVKQVTFTADAARRVGLQTAPVAANGNGVLVHYAALIYDEQGSPWVYEVPQPLTYKRTKVTVAWIEDHRVLLAAGPRPGTLVVTQGAAEVYGAELGMAGNH